MATDMDMRGKQEGFRVCVYPDGETERERYYCFALSVTHQGRPTLRYPLPAHMLLLPFLTQKVKPMQEGVLSLQYDK